MVYLQSKIKVAFFFHQIHFNHLFLPGTSKEAVLRNRNVSLHNLHHSHLYIINLRCLTHAWPLPKRQCLGKKQSKEKILQKNDSKSFNTQKPFRSNCVENITFNTFYFTTSLTIFFILSTIHFVLNLSLPLQAAGSISMAFLALLQLINGIHQTSCRSITAPTLFIYHFMYNVIQWNSVSSTAAALISPHLFLGLSFSAIATGVVS